jgi:hypothetical protein
VKILCGTASLPPSLSLLFLCYNPLFSFPTTFSAPLYPLSPHLQLPLLSFPNMSSHYLSFLHTHHLLTSLLYQLYPSPLKSLTYALSTTTTETHPNMHKSHKPQQPSCFFPQPPTFSCAPLQCQQYQLPKLLYLV